ncbi:MAG: hypothetical protein KatS3mg132_005 [Limisphaera sp.]|nr:MAG: hypothetical protein KatS3mg132_005 [Limisphaera sp.]
MMEATTEKLFAGGISSRFGRWVARHFYGWIVSTSVRRTLRTLVMKREGGPVYSRSVREILQGYHGVTVGMYSIGPCESDPGQFAPGTVIGRYCSVYYTARVLGASGPEEGVVRGGPAWSPDAPEPVLHTGGAGGVCIGHDVYIGHNAIIMPQVRVIGHGAVIGAGAVVHEEVPPYAVVTGNPARVVRYRFPASVVQKLLAEEWWWRTIDELTGAGGLWVYPPGCAAPDPRGHG